MKNLRIFFGRIGFWLGWPIWFFMLRYSQRTRVLIVSGKQVLVVRSWNGDPRWELPGGGIRRGESPTRAAAREVLEETGVVLDPAKLRSLGQATTSQFGLKFNFERFVVVLGDLPTPKAKSLDVIEAVWLPLEDAKANAAPYFLDLLGAWKGDV